MLQRCSLLLLLLGPTLLPASRTAAQQAPSPEQVLGYPLGAHFTPYAEARSYARALADASPRVLYQPYGATPERRELFQLVISTPDNLRRLDQIRAAHAELSEPGTPAARARAIARSTPAVVYLSYGIHGNEAASTEAALWTAWDLARDSTGTLDSLVVVMDPVANPDGRERYVGWYRAVVGARPDPDPDAREHHEPWPGGRFNHYLFDLNRDWAWGTQPETRARLDSWARWNPLVHVDFHEMGYNSSYFFPPAATPVNPIYPPHIHRWHQRFGETVAGAFDARGWAYFTGEKYDLFYPGYGDSWPALLGAVGMTYEQGGSGMAGLAIARVAGDTLTLRERAEHHRASGAATLRAAAAGKDQLMRDYAEGQRSLGRGEPDVLLVPGSDTLRLGALVEHLRRQGIQAERAGDAFRAAAAPFPGHGRRAAFPAGTYRVPARQPRGRLATTLLQPRTEAEAGHTYDITAWSLPYAYGVEAHQARGRVDARWSGFAGEPAATPAPAPEPGYGYLARPGEAAAASAVAFLRAGGRGWMLQQPFTRDGRRWPAGSWFFPAGQNPRLRERATAAGLGPLVTPVGGGLARDGADLGSDRRTPIRLPRLGVLVGQGIVPTSYGAHWFFLEQRLGLAMVALPVAQLTRARLALYDVLVVPDASSGALADTALAILRGWVRAGGRLVAVAGGADAVAGLAGVTKRAPASEDPAVGLLTRQQRERVEQVEEVSGVILPAAVDASHPLGWGAEPGEPLFVLHQGDLVFEPSSGAESVVHFGRGLQATSGVISEGALRRLEGGSWVTVARVGKGSVVLFAADPLFRLLWHSTRTLYINALLLDPAD